MYKLDRAWESSYAPQVKTLLKQLLPHLVEISTAPVEMDTQRATDFTIKLTGGDIAVRLRRANCKFRDLTIRALRDNGTKTELAKIREGHAFRYFYGWTDRQEQIADWLLVDLNKLRATRLLEKPLISNHDGTHFIAISARELLTHDCLMAYHLHDRKWEVAA